MKFAILVSLSAFLIGCLIDPDHTTDYEPPPKNIVVSDFTGGKICVGSETDISFVIQSTSDANETTSGKAPPQDPANITHCRLVDAISYIVICIDKNGNQCGITKELDLQKGGVWKVFFYRKGF